MRNELRDARVCDAERGGTQVSNQSGGCWAAKQTTDNDVGDLTNSECDVKPPLRRSAAGASSHTMGV